MKHTLYQDVKITKLMNSTTGAAGTSNLLSTALDMKGYDSVMFVISWGTITSGGVQSAYVTSADSAGGTYTAHDLTGSRVTVADTDDDLLTVINVVRPSREFLKVGIFRATQNAVVESIVAYQYRGRHDGPITQPASVQGSASIVTPVETTLSE